MYYDDITNLRCRPRGTSAECLVTWACASSGPYQVYLNGVRVRTVDTKSVILAVSTGYANHINVIRVDLADRVTDYSAEFSYEYGNRVTVQWPALAYCWRARMNVYHDATTGTVNYAAPVNPSPIEVFPNDAYARGFGLCGFGSGGFGWDGSNAIGFGAGAFGMGEFGFDAPMQSYKTDPLANGEYKFALKVVDAYGNLSDSATEIDVTVDSYPRSPKRLRVKAWNGETGALTLAWDQSTDIS
jgi:hypothetical protein